MAKKKEKKVKVEKVGGKSEKESPKTSNLDKLREEAVSLGMPEANAAKFDSEELLQDTIDMLKTQKKPVDTIKEQPDPKEEKKIEKQWRSKADRQKEFFDSQEQVRVLIPCDPHEKPGKVEEREINGRMETVAVSGAVWSKTFNGHRVVVPKGVYWPVAEYVAENIAREQNQVIVDSQTYGVDRVDPETGKPVREQL